MKLRPDDDIHRFEATWLDLRGWSLPFVARYVVWAAWAIVFLPLLVVALILTPLPFLYVLFGSAGASAAITYFVIAPRITPEKNLDALVLSFVSELQSAGAANARKAQDRRERPARTSEDWLDRLESTPEPTWNPVEWLKKKDVVS